MAIQVNKTVTGTEPVTLEQMKEWMKVDGDADDILITELITQGRSLTEFWLNISIVLQTIIIEATPRLLLQLPYQPVVSITSVTDRELNDLDYAFDGFRLSFTSLNDTITTMEAGYSDPPPGMVLGLKEVIAYLYDGRGDSYGTDATEDSYDGAIKHFIKRNQNLAAFDKTIWFR